MTGWRRLRALLAAASVLAGCAAARFEDGAYLVPAKGYRVSPPPGWERIPSEADLALRQPALGAGLMAHATCEGRTPTRPLPILARHLRFGLTEVTDLHEDAAEVAGRAARRSRFRARLDGTPVAVEALTVAGPRCVYDLVVVASAAGLARATPDFERFAASFALAAGQRTGSP